jgi:hypothetical protein
MMMRRGVVMIIMIIAVRFGIIQGLLSIMG